MYHKFKILLVEDDILEAKVIIKYLKDYGYDDVTHVRDSERASEVFNKGDVDFVIMDIELEGSKKNGIQLMEEMHKYHQTPALFLSNHGSNAILDQMKNVIELDYELKPIAADKLDFEIRRILKRHTLQEKENDVIKLVDSDLFFLKTNSGEYTSVRKKDITYLEADSSGTTIHHGGKSSFVYISLQKMAERLQHLPLVRTHQKYAVAINAIRTLTDTEITLTDSSTIAVSRGYRKSLKHKLGGLIIGR